VFRLWSQQELLEKMPGLMQALPVGQQLPVLRQAEQHVPLWHC